ncbi:DUF1003 domain-containing protein [Pelagibacterium luteolum]|uniref:Uncharacterized membrane protein n=1 Tax=Pelagibacterium luteolum TaxID=440168 RepID=A0A1G7RNV2_9HYPH|nr:DUF1003 domain-containing protein [Pelagibacterium luteolum]SDG12498.1 Uncharacterized membrane protein [Pelagibacterium luteolum]
MTDDDFESRLARGSSRYFGKDVDALSSVEHGVLKRALSRRTLARDVSEDYLDKLGFGDRMSDAIASFGGSWTFIILFVSFLVLWVASNIVLAINAFDPYPFIFLNLMLSMVAALQAPIIMMSQNRQAIKDRLAAAHDYEVNLKAEVEIMALHDKLDQMREHDLQALIIKQQEQIERLTKAVIASRSSSQ